MFYVYLMNSLKNNKIYIGFTSNLKRRFVEHNEGELGWTKRHRPWKLVYYEAFCSEEDARKRENSLKNYGNALRELRKRLKFSSGGTGVGSGAGFTLIETLIVVFLIGIVLVVGGNIFFGIMKGASKAEVEREVKQNGSYALAIMERMIKNSRSVLECDDFNNTLEILNSDRFSTTFQIREDSEVWKIASSSGEPPLEKHLYLTGDNVTVSDFTFECFYEPADERLPENLRRVGISFSLMPKGVVAGGAPPEMFAKIDFQTSVSLRNFPR